MNTISIHASSCLWQRLKEDTKKTYLSFHKQKVVYFIKLIQLDCEIVPGTREKIACKATVSRPPLCSLLFVAATFPSVCKLSSRMGAEQKRTRSTEASSLFTAKQ